jgi:hypothetical protein
MKTTVIEKITGKELPQEWAEKAGVQPDEEVEITIQPSREQRLRTLLGIMDRAGAEAESRGLTDKKLEELLKDES